MATFLYRLARGSFRHRRWILAAWLLLLVLLGAGAASLKTPSSDSFTIPGVQAQQASDLLTQRFPALSANGAQGLIVFEAPEGGTVASAPSRAAIESSLDALRKLPGTPLAGWSRPCGGSGQRRRPSPVRMRGRPGVRGRGAPAGGLS